MTPQPQQFDPEVVFMNGYKIGYKMYPTKGDVVAAENFRDKLIKRHKEAINSILDRLEVTDRA